MSAQPIDLLAHVDLGDQDRCFLDNPLFGQCRRSIQKLGDLLLHPITQRCGLRGSTAACAFDQDLYLCQHFAHHGINPGAFRFAGRG